MKNNAEDKYSKLKINKELLLNGLKAVKKMNVADIGNKFSESLNGLGFNSVDDVFSKQLDFSSIKTVFGEGLNSQLNTIEDLYDNLASDVNSLKEVGCGDSETNQIRKDLFKELRNKNKSHTTLLTTFGEINGVKRKSMRSPSKKRSSSKVKSSTKTKARSKSRSKSRSRSKSPMMGKGVSEIRRPKTKGNGMDLMKKSPKKSSSPSPKPRKRMQKK